MEDNREKSRQKEEEKYSHAGVLELAYLENGLFDAEKAAQERPDDEEAILGLEVARKKIELFQAEHDNAGAFKFKKFGRKIQELFEQGPDGKPGVEADENGELKLSEALAQRRFMLVNMGELDRFNKEGGGHAAGDAALGATAAAVEAAVTGALKDEKGKLTSDYQIYRYDGNTFMVDIASMPKEAFEALTETMKAAEPKVEGVEDAAPLTVRGLDLGSVIELVNHVQAELPKESKLEPGEDAARELVEVMRRAGDWDLEVNKLFKRAERLRGKIEGIAAMKEGTEADRKAKADARADAEAFFESYAKKSFQDTAFATFAQVEAAVKDGSYASLAEDIAIRTSEKRFADGRKVDDQIQEIVGARVRARNASVERTPLESAESVRQGGVTTEGARATEDKRTAMESLESLAGAASGKEAAVFSLRAQAARLEYRIETARRDKGTGLLERGVHYEDLEKAIEEGKDVATLFVDMGFLKYFDQMGGSDVGDLALKTAAAMMEEAVKMAGVQGKVYRYGGDEFTIQVEGGDAAARAVEAALEDLREASEPIASGEKSRAEYAPTRLSFNYGRADMKMLEDLHALAARNGKYSTEELEDPAGVRNDKAELMTQAADVGIEYNKAYSRFMLLIEELRSPEYKAGGDRVKQVESLMVFSDKAIFGSKEKLKEFADSGMEGDALDEAVIDFVLEKVAAARAAESGKKEVLDALLASQVKVAFLQDRLEAMKGVVDLQQHRIDKLQESLKKAEEEKRQLIEARGSIDRAA